MGCCAGGVQALGRPPSSPPLRLPPRLCAPQRPLHALVSSLVARLAACAQGLSSRTVCTRGGPFPCAPLTLLCSCPVWQLDSKHQTTWEVEQTGCGRSPKVNAWLGLASFEYPTIWMWRGEHRQGRPSVPPYPRHDYEQQGAYAGSTHQPSVRKVCHASCSLHTLCARR